MVKINIAFAGGQCVGKSTTAMFLTASLKEKGYDYDYIGEESRKLKKEFGDYQTTFERFYMWRQQEREELRSTAENGFITDTPLFQLYAGARVYAKTPRDKLAVRELFRMCQELDNRYQLIVIAKDPAEIPYKTDSVRRSGPDVRIRRHQVIRSFVEHMWPEKLLFVEGKASKRVKTIEKRLEEVRKAMKERGNVPF